MEDDIDDTLNESLPLSDLEKEVNYEKMLRLIKKGVFKSQNSNFRAGEGYN